MLSGFGSFWCVAGVLYNGIILWPAVVFFPSLYLCEFIIAWEGEGGGQLVCLLILAGRRKAAQIVILVADI